ncbi:MAG TPA: N-acetylmuramoyl-L-alanine amidase [Kofleriaceae bacterium]|nr:N-acetylmuramoyl-L-alanine amidase [Kofleriaceae bacterium]
MRILRASFAAIAALALSPACATDDTGPVPVDEGPDTPGLDDDFARASREFGVPADLLKAVSYVETQWQMVDGQDEHEGRPAGGGVYGLWGENLTAAAAAIKSDVDTVRYDEKASLRAGAARLAQLAEQNGVSGDDLAAWEPVLADFIQSDLESVRKSYVTDVMRTLAAGAKAVAEDGTVIARIAPHAEITVPPPTFTPSLTADYGPAIWRASPNYNSRNGYAVSLVVIHSCEGNYAGCWGWLVQSQAQASAHYVVREDGGEISQLVTEANRAWHVAATYDCANAGGAQCNLTGVSTNNFSVGIEHAGFASQASWSSGIIEASAKLTCDITQSHGVVRDRNHIVSHGQLQPYNRTDPGPNWPWTQYIDRVRANCGEGGTGGEIIVDSNNANNDAAVANMEVTADWVSATSTPGYYGSGYWYANTAPSSSPATFWFYLGAAGTKTIDAWWTTGTNRSTAATFIAYNAAGTEVGRRSVSQQTGGSTWNALGTWSFSAGWNKVQLSRWAAEGSVVIADAIRVR